jgi:hypothetical protein
MKTKWFSSLYSLFTFALYILLSQEWPIGEFGHNFCIFNNKCFLAFALDLLIESEMVNEKDKKVSEFSLAN